MTNLLSDPIKAIGLLQITFNNRFIESLKLNHKNTHLHVICMTKLCSVEWNCCNTFIRQYKIQIDKGCRETQDQL